MSLASQKSSKKAEPCPGKCAQMKPLDIFTTIKHFGISFVALSVWCRLARNIALFRRKFPVTRWDKLDLESFIAEDVTTGDLKPLIVLTRFFPLNGPNGRTILLGKITDISDVARSADEIINGNVKYFCKDRVSIKQPVDWHINPFNGAHWPADMHWCNLRSFINERGDIKSVWELSRFSWTYELVRAYLATGQTKYAEAFWELFEQWLRSNEPNRGVNWQCGQECALRVMAWCFALFGFRDAPSTTEERVKKMLLAFAVHGERIEKHISDAIRQKSNHSMTEATGLYTIGTLFVFFKQSQKWRRMGKEILEREGLRQIYEDGSYLQQSMNYHRLMLQAYLWSLHLAELNEDSFSPELRDRLLKATEFLYQMQDDSTGRVPNYGANDGALIVPLNSCDYLNYRPVIQSCWYLLKRERLYESGPWDEDLLWLFGPAALNVSKADKQRKSLGFSEGGYYTLRSPSKKSWAMIRCHSYRDRVGHIDFLHTDLWADGLNLLRDCGSYKYFAPDEPEFERYFKSIWAHNTIVVDDQSPLRLVSHFIYLPWPKAELKKFERGENKIEWEGTHLAYNRSPWHIIHRRRITVQQDDRWEIHDDLQGRGKHKLELRWHLPSEAKTVEQDLHYVLVKLPAEWMLKVETDSDIKVELLQAEPKGGLESLYYACKTPIHTLSVATYCQLPSTFRTTVWKEPAR